MFFFIVNCGALVNRKIAKPLFYCCYGYSGNYGIKLWGFDKKFFNFFSDAPFPRVFRKFCIGKKYVRI